MLVVGGLIEGEGMLPPHQQNRKHLDFHSQVLCELLEVRLPAELQRELALHVLDSAKNLGVAPGDREKTGVLIEPA